MTKRADTDAVCPVVHSTLCPSGCPYDLEIREVRNGSLVLLWATPLYEGQGPVTGYLLEISQGDQSEDWTSVNKKTISDTHYKVRNTCSRPELAGPHVCCCMLMWAPLYRRTVSISICTVFHTGWLNNWLLSRGIQVAGLQAGETYRLRVSAVNQCGVGRASLPSEPVTVQTRPGQSARQACSSVSTLSRSGSWRRCRLSPLSLGKR